jgi:hypothetical protein
VAKGLSNYVIFEHSKQDPKIAAHAARTGQFVDDEDGNLVAVGDGPQLPKGSRLM